MSRSCHSESRRGENRRLPTARRAARTISTKRYTSGTVPASRCQATPMSQAASGSVSSEPDAGQLHERRGPRHERHTKPGSHERQDGEQLVRLLHDARRESRRRTDAQRMIVEARGPRPRDDDERFGRDGPQPDPRLPRAARTDREDEPLVEDRADDEPIAGDREAYEADVDLARGEALT